MSSACRAVAFAKAGRVPLFVFASPATQIVVDHGRHTATDISTEREDDWLNPFDP